MSFDVAECISLHNLIVERACTQLPAHLKPTVIRNWFTAHSLDASNPDLEFELTDSLKEFLSGIDVVIPQDSAHMAFTPFLVGVASPSEMMPGIWEDFPGYGEFILLYRNAEYEPGGLVMHLDTHGVTLLETAEEDPCEAQYVGFEATLKQYLSYIDAGKYVVDTSYERSGYGDELACQGWRYEDYLEQELESTLDVWNHLIDSIASRIPGAPTAETDEVLVPLSVLDPYPSVTGFARAFLSRAKKPPFKMIAPELRVPDADWVHRIGPQLSQRYPPATDPLELRCPSANFLLFPWSRAGMQFSSTKDSNKWTRRILDDRAGLYLTPQASMANCATMLLPFAIGQHGHVLRGDGTQIDWPGHDVLYQHGMCVPSVPAHGTSLDAILMSWWEQIENANWDVNENGVTGGEDKWGLADTEELAEAFKVEYTCGLSGEGSEADEGIGSESDSEVV